jgi:hypothetical protein
VGRSAPLAAVVVLVVTLGSSLSARAGTTLRGVEGEGRELADDPVSGPGGRAAFGFLRDR